MGLFSQATAMRSPTELTAPRMVTSEGVGGHVTVGIYNPSQTLHVTAIYAYIDPQNHPNVGKYTIHGVSG